MSCCKLTKYYSFSNKMHYFFYVRSRFIENLNRISSENNFLAIKTYGLWIIMFNNSFKYKT